MDNDVSTGYIFYGRCLSQYDIHLLYKGWSNPVHEMVWLLIIEWMRNNK